MMKRMTAILTIVALALMLSVTFVYAQGRGMGAGNLRVGQPCPLGYTEPNPNPAGWWTGVTPTTPEQKAFIDRTAELHKQIRDKRFEADNLRATGGDPKRIAALDQEVGQLRAEHQKLMQENWQLRQQMGLNGRGMRGGGMGWNRAAVRGPGQNGMGMQGQPMGRGPGMGQGRMAGLNPNCPRR